MAFTRANLVRIAKGGGAVQPQEPPQFTSAVDISVNENETLAHVLSANQACTFSIPSGLDTDDLEIVGGVLRWAGNVTRDYEDPDDSNLNNKYSVFIRATSTATGFFTDTAHVVTVIDTPVLQDDTVDPVITGGASVSDTVVEGAAIGGTLAADEAVTWSVSGTDAAFVTLNAETGVWALAPTDYETKTSYSFTFTATDPAGNTDTQAHSYTITNDVSDDSADYPASVLAQAWAPDVWDLQDAANTGYRTAPTKVIGVDTLPSGASYTNGSGTTMGTITLSGSGGTLSGWNLTAHTVLLAAANWTIEDNLFNPADGKVHSSYLITNPGYSGVTVRYNTFDGRYGASRVSTHVHCSGACHNFVVTRNRCLTPNSDTMKIGYSSTSTSTRPQITYNYMDVGAWITDAEKVAGADPHFDALTVFEGAAFIKWNFFNLKPYTGPASRPALAKPYNLPPAEAGDRFSYGTNNAVRCQSANNPALQMANILIDENIVFGHKRTVTYPFQFVNYGTWGALSLSNNIIEDQNNGAIVHPTLPGGAFAFTFAGNTRFSDGATYTTIGGLTGGPPSAPVLVEVLEPSSTSIQLVYDRAGGAGANNNHQYALSTNGGSSYGSWTTLTTSTNTVSGLTDDATYHVKLRGIVSGVAGPESNVVSVTL